MSPRALLLPFLCVLALLSPAAHAQVAASLVAAERSVQPGREVLVALRLEHDKKWHTYWLNPGTGLPTTLKWQLPPGWKASEIRWPAPHVTRDSEGTITGNGYEGVVHFPVTLTPPADLRPGDTVTLAAEAKWLMCELACVPGQASLTLTLPVLAAAPEPDPASGAAIRDTVASLPRALPEVVARTTREGAFIVLRVSAPAGVLAAPRDPWFFSNDNSVQYDAPQTLLAPAAGEHLALRIPLSPDAPAPSRLRGVLRTEGSWTPAGAPLPALEIDTPVETAPGAIASGNGPRLAFTPATAEAATEARTFVGTLLLAFVGGLILNLMPCVFPVLGIKILGFVNQAGADRRKVTLHGLAFAAGVLLSFWTLAGALALLRAGGDQLGWGFQLQSPAFVFSLAAVMLVFALSMSGVFEFGLSATGVGAGLQSKQGFAGSFFTGVLATVVATPCSAPFLAPALGAALALPVAESFAVFTAIALGLALPYLLLSLFPQAIKALPRPGAWMETFKQAMAFPLYATAGYLVWVLAYQLKDDDTALLAVLLGLVVVAMGVWLYGRYAAPGAKPARARFGLVGGLGLLAGGLALGWPGAPSPVNWKPWSPEAIELALADGKPVYVDFTARWCFTCQTNKKVVFGSDAVLRAFDSKNVVALRADWTDSDPAITEELARWNRSAVPFNLVYLPGRKDPIVLPELLTPGIVLDALDSR